MITNNLTTKVNVVDSSLVPSFGDSFAHRINNRILLERKSGNLFSASTLKSTLNTESTIHFRVNTYKINKHLLEN